jgi:endo-1,4-beta-xylanase
MYRSLDSNNKVLIKTKNSGEDHNNTNINKDDDDDGPTLRQVIERCCRTIDIGAAVLPKPLREDVEYAECLEQEFTAIVVEHHLKWTPLCHQEPGPFPDETPSDRLGRYDFHFADQVVDWAISRGMKVKGHVLCWHITTPVFLEVVETDELRKQLRQHIFTVMGHYRGRIRLWDVVNEALAPDGTLADNIFLRKLGPSYIDDCFRWAHEADPSAILLYNDNKVEGIGSPKSDAFYELLSDMKNKGVPVHGCGLQAHFDAAGTGRSRPPTPRMVKEQIHRLGKLGLSVNISELDVRVSRLPEELRQTAQKQIYHDIVAAALTEPAVDGIWLWGFTDLYTWVTHFYYKDEPLIFDQDYNRKEAYYSFRDALSTLTVGGIIGGNVLLDSDVDDDGNQWGHLWMQPDPEDSEDEELIGDSRPDWDHEVI